MKKISFVHISDLHYKDDYTGQHSEKLTAKTGKTPTDQFTSCIHKIIKDNPVIDFFIISGDLGQHCDIKEYSNLKQLLDKELMGIPYFVTMGNHDNEESFSAIASKPLLNSRSDYSIDFDGLRIISIDSRGGEYQSGLIEKEQLDWLEIELQKPSERGSILFLHHTPQISGEIEFLAYQMTNPKDLFEVVKGSDIKSVFCGHTHKRYESNFGKIPCHTVESLSFEIKSLDDRMLISNTAGYNFCILEDEVLNVKHVDIVPEERKEITLMYADMYPNFKSS